MSGKKAFLDTNLFIYLIKENSKYLDKIYKLFDFLEKNNYQVITSTLTFGEILTKSYKDKRLDLIKSYRKLFRDIDMVELNMEIAEFFAKFRAKYNIKTPDSIQLASAIYTKCELFITNVKNFVKFKSVKCCY